jgi:hypothetical protein
MWKQAKPIERHESEMARLALRALVWLFALVLGALVLEFATGCALPPEHERQEHGAGLPPAEKEDPMATANKGQTSLTADLVVGNALKNPSFQCMLQPFAHTVQFGLDSIEYPPGLPAPPINFAVPPRVEATVVWSVAGNSVTRKLIVGPGSSISGAGESVRVSMRDASEPGIFPFGFGLPSYKVSAQVVPGTRSTNVRPTYQPTTADLGTFLLGAGGTSAFIPVPQDIGATSVLVLMSRGAAIGLVRVEQLYIAGGGLIRAYDPMVFSDFVPLAPQVGLVITNGEAYPIQFSIIYGIDG